MVTIMSEVEDLFNEAYCLDVVEEHHAEAIELCRQALKVDPDNYRVKVFLGGLLGDHGNDQEKIEARKLFLDAIEKAENPSLFCTTWPEETAIHHLGIWEWGQGHYSNAILFFLIDWLVCHNSLSYDYLFEILRESDPNMAKDIELILRRLKE